MDKLYYERADYSVVVKNRAPPPIRHGGGRFTGPEMPTRSNGTSSDLGPSSPHQSCSGCIIATRGY